MGCLPCNPYGNAQEMNVDWLICEIKKALAEWISLGKQFDDLEQQFEDLKSYVENYFKNLDIQEEIDNKLDEMAEDGTLQAILENYAFHYVTPQLYGAKGDGITDDTQAITSAINNDKGYPVFIPAGIYKCNNVELSQSVIMSDDAFLSYNGTGLDTFLTIPSNNKNYKINIDCNGLNPLYALLISGNNNHIEHVKIKNVYYNGSQPANAGIMFTGSNNIVDFIHGENFSQPEGTVTNDSCPQVVSTLNTATENYINTCTFYDCVSGVVHASSGVLRVGSVTGTNMEDNCCYIVRGGVFICDTINSENCDETLAVITDNYTSGATKTTAYINNINAKDALTDVIRYRNAGKIVVNNVVATGEIYNVFLAFNDASQNSDGIFINSLYVDGFVKALAFCPNDRGTSSALHIGDFYAVCKYRSSWATSRASYCRLDNFEEVRINNFSLKIVDFENALAVNTTFNININGTTKLSYIGKMSYEGLDGSMNPKNMLARINFNSPYQQFYGVRYDSTNDYIILSNDAISYFDKNCSTNPPSWGTWNRGDIIYNINPTYENTILGWVCVESGTPGTWAVINVYPQQ